MNAMVVDDCEVGLSDREFRGLRDILYRETGITLHDGKRIMVQSRLLKRLRHLGLADFGEYVEYLQRRDPKGTELLQMINCMTTNKTDFYREAHHFELLKEQVFKPLQEKAATTGKRQVRIWCAASSTGEEPYTLAMTALEFFGPNSGWDIRILASDIDTNVLQHAERGVYDAERLEPVSNALKAKYFTRRRTAKGSDEYEASDALKSILCFRRVNLISPDWPIKTQFDAIFCRNVIIYFNSETQDQLLTQFVRYLKPAGYLYLGHSESIMRLGHLYTSRGQTVYQLAAGSHEKHGTAQAPHHVAVNPPEPSRKVPPALANLPSKTIIVGELSASSTPVAISTVLGSCVSACIYDEENGVGGMNHYMLPDRSATPSANYGYHAMEGLIRQILRKGGERGRLRAKIFGGANVVQVNGPLWKIGEKNIQFARDFLAAAEIPIESECVGGEQGMQVRFAPHLGKAFVRLLDKQAAPELKEELEVLQKLLSQPGWCVAST